MLNETIGTKNAFKITIHMVSSLDGFIAKKDNSTSWFETADYYDKGVEITKQEADDFLKTIDCYVMGSRTYELAMELSKNYGWPYGELPTIVLTHKHIVSERKNIQFYSGDLTEMVMEHLQPYYKNVWVVGGASLVQDFIRLELADEIRLSILPVMLGDGLRLFDNIEQEQALHLKNITAYKSGMVELHYEILK